MAPGSCRNLLTAGPGICLDSAGLRAYLTRALSLCCGTVCPVRRELAGRRGGLAVATGIFQARMQVGLVNDGPVTIVIDTKNRE